MIVIIMGPISTRGWGGLNRGCRSKSLEIGGDRMDRTRPRSRGSHPIFFAQNFNIYFTYLFFWISEFGHRANRQNHRYIIIQTPPIEHNGINSIIVRNMAPSIHGNPIFS